jgi:hypothetical protein
MLIGQYCVKKAQFIGIAIQSPMLSPTTSVSILIGCPVFGRRLTEFRIELKAKGTQKMGIVYINLDAADFIIASFAHTFEKPSSSFESFGLTTAIPEFSSPLLTKVMFSALDIATAPQFAA